MSGRHIYSRKNIYFTTGKVKSILCPVFLDRLIFKVTKFWFSYFNFNLMCGQNTLELALCKDLIVFFCPLECFSYDVFIYNY